MSDWNYECSYPFPPIKIQKQKKLKDSKKILLKYIRFDKLFHPFYSFQYLYNELKLLLTINKYHTKNTPNSFYNTALFDKNIWDLQ